LHIPLFYLETIQYIESLCKDKKKIDYLCGLLEHGWTD
jgi:hypothetical protein